MKKVILDTNILLECVKNKVDIFSLKDIVDYDICILDKSIEELNKIVNEQKGKHKEHAKLALQLIKGKVKVLESVEGKVDDILVSLSEDNIIVTQDKELKKRLKGKVIVLKQGKYFSLE